MTSTILQLSEPFGRVSYCRAGPNGSPDSVPVVLIHGVGMQAAAWGPQFDELSKTHRVIALDMPGHGGSDPIAPGSDLSVFLDWLLVALDALEIRQASLIGHSMGALIAGGFTVCHPHRVARVALLNGVFRRDAEAKASVIARSDTIRSGSFDLETPLSRWFGDSGAEQAARADVARWLSQVDIDGYATAYGAFARGDGLYADSFGKITCPLLALTGEADPNSTPAMSRAMADAAANGRSVIIENHRHMVNLTAPDAVNAALMDWLSEPSEQGELT